MGTRYLFEKAVKISQDFDPSDRTLVRNRCRSIRESQQKLLAAAETAMFNCLTRCRGICCQSLDIDSVFSLWDFIFILMLQPHLKDEMQSRLQSRTPLYLSPCPFLRDKKGPCILPDGVKAQLCVITFCSKDEKIKPPVKAVNLEFYKLCWLIQYLRLKRMVRKISGLFQRNSSGIGA